MMGILLGFGFFFFFVVFVVFLFFFPGLILVFQVVNRPWCRQMHSVHFPCLDSADFGFGFCDACFSGGGFDF